MIRIKTIRIGTRGSKLALAQTHEVISKIKAHSADVECEIVKIKTQGDRDTSSPLSEIGGAGVFLKEIEEQIINNNVDAGIHSMKDVPTELPDQLCISAVTERVDARDVLITADGKKLSVIKKNAVIGTGSARRKIQLLKMRNDFIVKDLRGNLDTRIGKLREGHYDAIAVAYAGIKRLGITGINYEFIPVECMLPAAGQGCIAVETRKGDAFLKELFSKINHGSSEIAVRAERAFLKRTGGGCRLPISAYAEINDRQELLLRGMIASGNGRALIKHFIVGSAADPEGTGEKLAEIMLYLGGDDIIEDEKR